MVYRRQQNLNNHFDLYELYIKGHFNVKTKAMIACSNPKLRVPYFKSLEF